MATLKQFWGHARTKAAIRSLAIFSLSVCAGVASGQDADTPLVSQVPLSAGGRAPGNIVLTPSVEFPTVNSKANIGAFNINTSYYGYFDQYKCYRYNYDAVEANRHFYPIGTAQATPARCNGGGHEWSGNWLNWAGTQTIDGFRKALTGGLRVTDTATDTILEKARHDGQGGSTYYPNSSTAGGSAVLQQVVPVPGTNPWTTLTTRIFGGGNQMYLQGSLLCPGRAELDSMPGAALPPGTIAAAVAQEVVDYDPAVHVFNTANTTSPVINVDCDVRTGGTQVDWRPRTNSNRIYRVSMRVKVCVPGSLEDNCVQYGSNYKPEGLIQRYQEKMRFSVFGYLVDNQMFRDGGVLRANQKYVGPERLNASTGLWEDNPNKEWDPDTGVFYPNPNPNDVTATNTAGNLSEPDLVRNSGVINYINKFAQSQGIFAKNFDPVSELYYAATRYLRGLPPIATYNDLTRTMNNNGAGTVLASAYDRWRMTDNFPVITNWEDPYQYWCQNSSIIGIGDVYTHRDKNLAGRESTTDEPTAIGDAGTDPDFTGAGNQSVAWWSQRAYEIEGLTYPTPPFGGLQNGPYMVGLAFYAHTQDLRDDLVEKQTASTHWVDVREGQRVEPRRRNQYWMATKYGGFLLPADPDEFDAATRTDPLPNDWWATTDSITSNGSATGTYPNETFTRNSNYYSGDRPDLMIDGLTRAFAKFGSESTGSGASLAANSTRLDTQTLTFQAQFQNSIWMGQLNAYSVNSSTGALSASPVWTAGQNMPAWNSRNIYVNARDGSTDNYVEFQWDNLSGDQQDALGDFWSAMPAGVDGEDVLEYLRGNQALEEAQTNGVFRTRTPPANWSHMLGDIVNSTPVFVGSPNPALYASSPGVWDGKTEHDDFAASTASRRPVVWVGSNGGMLHAFDASINANGTPTANSGDEVYAFVPNIAIETGLVQIANPDYSHQYFVDGDLAVADVYDGANWRTVLVGTTGRGGPGVFALDVTDPDDVEFLWELDRDDIADLGHNIGRPVIAQVANGDWRVLFGNGIDSADGSANLITIDVIDGDWTSTQLDAGPTNGLSAVLARDTNSDGLSDTVYAGDLEGSLWKITNIAGSPSGSRIFSAVDDGGNPQPITAAPLVGRDPSTLTTWVFVGTGKYLNEDDLVDTQQQTWYGIKDTGTAALRGEMVEREIIATGTIGDFTVRTISDGTAAELVTADGWYMDLPVQKERIVVPNRFQGSALIGTTRIPDASDACRPSGRGYIMAINPFTGGRLDQTFFDANRDGLFNDSDELNGNIVSGIGIDSSPNNPIFIENVMQFSKDDGTTDAVRVQGSNAEARRASWREITRQ
jgi:type IV pilus assembly protein PilY1